MSCSIEVVHQINIVLLDYYVEQEELMKQLMYTMGSLRIILVRMLIKVVKFFKAIRVFRKAVAEKYPLDAESYTDSLLSMDFLRMVVLSYGFLYNICVDFIP